ncbi:MAG TPA: zinc-ribbon domain-containing protein [Myxococcota bacterium]|nr:zinc-ribbon domain-containing protein [Myxococcota bacterium]HRY92263.1 zinc-ribbon domain-containing protein [Myxococcota bacterium]HSA22439.1 zinc-ribbon domain-containing protein [Myxococcota bacterium]
MRDALKCPLCGEVFELKPEDLPEKGLLVVCPRCKHTFELEEAAEFPSYAEGRPSSD